MGKSKGRVPIKGGSKKVRQIKNVQEGGGDIGSEKGMDIEMTKLLHLFKYIVDNDKDQEELKKAVAQDHKANVVDELKKNLAKLFYFLGGDISIILLRQKGRFKIDKNSVDDYDEEKGKGYKNAMEKLGFSMEEVKKDAEGVLEIAQFKDNLPDVTDEIKTAKKIIFPEMVFAEENNFNENWDKKMQLDLDNSEFTINENTITISNKLHKVLGIPGDLKVTNGDITVHIDIFNEYRLPILHHILNLRIHLQKISDEDKLNNFFYKEEQENKKKAILLSLATGRFLNATGYHIKPEKKLARFELDSEKPMDETVSELLSTKMLNLFQESGNTQKDRAAAGEPGIEVK